MYRKFFGLNKLPFKSSPDIDVFYKSGSRQNILEALVYTVSRGDGITKVTGEVGSGKTMLLRLLADSLPKYFTILYINTPNLSPKDMLMHICAELGLKTDGLALKFSLLDLINKELVRLYSEGRRVVMLIDEAQAMTFDTLEEIRLLSNLETNDEKLLQVVLFGQPELDVALSNDKIRQLKSRISYSIFIPSLSPEEVCSYLNYRLRKSSYEGLDIFDLKVSREIHRLSGGMPRTINLIADKLLMSAFSSDDKKVTKKHIAMLPKDTGSVAVNQNNKYLNFILFFTLAVILIAVLYLVFTLRLPKDSLVLAPSSIKSLKENANASIDSEPLNNYVALSTTESEDEATITRESDPLMDTNIEVVLNSDDLELSGVKLPKELLNTEDFRVKGSLLSKRLVDLHLNTVEWLTEMPEQMYIVQLASPHINTLDDAMAFYSEQNVSIDSIHFLIDLGRSDQKNRLRVFYLASASYSTLERIISELSPELKASMPYIVTVGGVRKNMEYTQYNLKQHGIINVTQ